MGSADVFMNTSFLFSADHKNLVIFGQKSLRLGCLNEGSFQVTTEVAQFQDWIWDVQSLSEPQQHLAVALGHNTVALWDCDQWLCKEVISCQENCILYPWLYLP